MRTTPVLETPDSIFYKEADWSGRGRFPVIPQIFEVFGSEQNFILFQIFLSSFSITLLLFAVLVLCKSKTQELIVSVALASVSVYVPFRIYDNAIYSESISISVLLLSLGSTLLALSTQSRPLSISSFLLLGIGLLLSESMKPALIAPICILATVAYRSCNKKMYWSLLGLSILVPLFIGSIWTKASETGVALPSDVKVLMNRDGVSQWEWSWQDVYFAYWRDEVSNEKLQSLGMPIPSEDFERVGTYYTDETFVGILKWARQNGSGPYIKLMISQPEKTASIIWSNREQIRSQLNPLSGTFGSNFSVPQEANIARQDVIRNQYAIAFGYVFMSISILMLLFSQKLRFLVESEQKLLIFGLAIVMSGIFISVMASLGSTIEWERHGILSAILYYIGLALTMAALIEGVGRRIVNFLSVKLN